MYFTNTISAIQTPPGARFRRCCLKEMQKLPTVTLREGAAADVIVTDYIPLTPMNAGNVNSHILFGMTGRSVTTTVGNGKVLMKDRILTNIDEEKVMADCRQAAKELADRINSR